MSASGRPKLGKQLSARGRYLPVNSTRLGEDLIEKGIADVKAVPVVQIENDRVIVTEWTFAPGAETGQHIHTFDYVVVPLTSGTLRLVEPEGSRDAQLTAGVSYTRPAGVNHNVINLNTHEFRFLEIELK
ncbi:MAG: cupin domain-containing protein [Alphaproteobacteria bacterium]|nr:MAG: cupin domain-containing protein [Alphaproteobacteria bacterium]